MKPKFVSISYEVEGDYERVYSSLTALDDTGQLWYLHFNTKDFSHGRWQWTKFPDYVFATGPEPVKEDK